MNDQAIHAWVSGKVQGVYYRASTAKKAKALDLTGWVKNLEDGRVELFAQGPECQVEKLLSWCEQGPILAKVANIDKEIAEPDKHLASFEVRR